MFCKKCYASLEDDAKFCPSCGEKVINETYCPGCNAEIKDDSTFCKNCGSKVKETVSPENNYSQFNSSNSVNYTNANTISFSKKSKTLAGVLGILIGGFGIHNFYLGYTTKGIIQVVLVLVGGALTGGVLSFFIGVWGLIEGILILTGSISLDGQGNTLQ